MYVLILLFLAVSSFLWSNDTAKENAYKTRMIYSITYALSIISYIIYQL